MKLVAALALVTVGCAPTAPLPPDERAPDADAARASAGGLSAAGTALLVQSRNERRSGDYAQASATLERALRIEPTAPAIWLELARVRLLEGDYTQAEQLARKARSLGAGDQLIIAGSDEVIAEASRKRRSNASGAQVKQ